jgi:nucleoside-diphosphate-sugar epimerase
MPENIKYLVFGATGLVGSEIVNQLLDLKKDVTILVRKPIDNPNVRQIVGDIVNKDDVIKACQGMDVAFQTVAVIDWNPRMPDAIYKVNVEGNRNVINACITCGVKKLIYTSSIDVVFNGQEINNGDESIPYPDAYLDHYSKSKALAEKEVIKANGTAHQNGHLWTCSLRTAGIYGPMDRVRMPTLIEAMRKGKYMHIGDGSSKFSHVYSGNVAHAHILASDTLGENSGVDGECFFITDHPAANFFEHVEKILRPLGYTPSQKSVPCWLLKIVAFFSELTAKIFKPKKAPLLTRYTVAANCNNFNFVSEKAKERFGYTPIFSLEESIKLTVEGLKKRGYGSNT